MSENERLDTIQLLAFIIGRPEVFYARMTDEQLDTEYEKTRSVDMQ